MRSFLAVLLGIAVLVPPSPASGQAPGRGPVRFEAVPGETLLVHGTYPPTTSRCVNATQPLHHERYRGAVEVHRADDGRLTLVGELSFQDYLKGIAEVPRRWPMEALKAQVVAARTYALSQLDPGGLYDLCATDACQVYAGTLVELGPWGNRWARAVDETDRQALLWQGEPAQTFYFSTSNGRTYSNAEIWGGTPLPYLPGIEEEDDHHSPLSRWRVELPFSDLARFLAADGRWGGGHIRRVTVEDGTFTLRGPRGRTSLDKRGLRAGLNATAACLDPDYPPTEPDGYRLPQTVPSVWYRAEVEGRRVVLTGRGWGHGIGMVQWGAYGKARRGLSHDDILAAYYGGLRPEGHGAAPETIRVLLATGLTSVTVAPSGEATVDRGRADPPWRVTGGRNLRVRSGSPPPAVLEADGASLPRRIEAGTPLRASVEVSAPALVRLEVTDGQAVVAAARWRPFADEPVRLRERLPGLAPGRYAVRLAATDGVDTIRSGARPLRVLPGAEPFPSPAPTPSPTATELAEAPVRETGDTRLPVTAAVLAGLAGLLLLLTAARRKRHHPS